MNEAIPIFQKLGCEKYSLDSCILVRESVEAVNTIIQQYFELEVQSHCSLVDYLDARKAAWIEVERQRQVRKFRNRKSLPPIIWAVPFWRYCNHQWVVLPLSGRDDSIAFALAVLLNTDAITFYDSPRASCNEFKLFRKDRLVEHYLFGFECGEDLKNDWDLKIEDSQFDEWNLYEHRFKSSIRQVTEVEIKSAVLSKKYNRDNRGFLDVCLKYYKAYIPLLEETPYHYHGESNSDFKKWNAVAERMDIMLMPSNWSHVDWNVPDRVT